MLSAQAAPVENYAEYLPDGANRALVVQKMGAPQPVIDYHSQQMALPASTMKLLTALAALLQLSWARTIALPHPRSGLRAGGRRAARQPDRALRRRSHVHPTALAQLWWPSCASKASNKSPVT